MSSPSATLAPFDGPADVVVVGGGSAGCVVASRLSEDPSRRVVLLEAGPEYDLEGPNELTELYGGKPVMQPKYYWPGLEATTASSTLWPRGQPPRVSYKQPMLLGGGSAINGQIALRGAPADFEEWVRLGATGWGWDDVLPYFKALEHDLDFGGPLHGQAGPVSIRRTPQEQWDSTSLALTDALLQLGHPYLEDLNGEFAAGHGPVPMNNDGTIRCSMVRAYLGAEVRRRHNLRVVTDIRATRVRIENKQVVGVEALKDGSPIFLPAHQVVLSAGAINTPCLLMHSGVGPGEHLRSFGIEVVEDRPGVGGNLHNHPMTSVSAYTEPEARTVRPQRRVFTYVRYSSGVPGCPSADMVLSTSARSMWHAVGRRIFTISPSVGIPYSTGSVRLSSADPMANPVIDNNCLADPRDLARLREGFKFAARLMLDHLHPKFVGEPFPTYLSKRVERLAIPKRSNQFVTWAGAMVMDASPMLRKLLLEKVVRQGPTLAHLLSDDRLLEEFLAERVNLAWHHTSTARMGAADDPGAVVDPGCAVMGVDGLYVADASIMPRITRTNPQIPTIMIGERAAELIAGAGRRAAIN